MNNNLPFVVALILTYNDSIIVKKCIDSVRKSDYSELEIYLIDNGSKAKFIDQIRSDYPTLNIFALNENTGFSGAFNHAIKSLLHSEKRKISYFWLLKNDLEVESDTLSKLVESIIDKPKIGFAGPETLKRGKLREHDQWITFLPNPKNPGIVAIKDEIYFNNEKTIEVTYVVGHCMLVNRKFIEENGLMRDFFIYFEEVEWQYRARLNGWKSVAIPNSIAYHDRNSFLKPFNTYLRTRNYIFFNRAVLINDSFFIFYFINNILLLFKDGIISIFRCLYDKNHRKNFIKGIIHGIFWKLPDYRKI